MLVNLHVKNLAIIDEIEVDFQKNFNVMTGETGAGKSIIIGSINLALGGKASRDIIRMGADYALVELAFSVDSDKEREQLANLDIIPEDGMVLLSRKIYAGRSVTRINGESVTVATLKKVASIFIDIHGQNEQQSLLYESKHMEILDRYAGEALKEWLVSMKVEYEEYIRLLSEEKKSQVPEEERRREISFLQYELQEIENASLKHGEEKALAEEYKTLSNSVNIQKGLGEVYGMTETGTASVSELLGCSLRILSHISGYDKTVEDLQRELSEIEDLVSDFNRDLSSYQDDLQTDPLKTLEVEKRLDLIRNLKAKYGVTTGEVMEYADRIREKLERYEQYEGYRDALREKILKQEEKMSGIAQKITNIRKKAAKVLEVQIENALKELNFLQSSFRIEIQEEKQYSVKGKDKVIFMFSANPGEMEKPLGEAASGGELSRVMLAVKTVLADHDEIATLIFDEIDVGISGRTAQMVAEKMAYIGKNHQVICISHLAQIAAMADSHFLIEKSSQNNHTATGIVCLEEEGSIEELARILGGVEITKNVYNSALEMRKMAEKVKKQIRN